MPQPLGAVVQVLAAVKVETLEAVVVSVVSAVVGVAAVVEVAVTVAEVVEVAGVVEVVVEAAVVATSVVADAVSAPVGIHLASRIFRPERFKQSRLALAPLVDALASGVATTGAMRWVARLLFLQSHQGPSDVEAFQASSLNELQSPGNTRTYDSWSLHHLAFKEL